MIKQIKITGIIFLFTLVILLSGCTESQVDLENFIGTWKYELYDEGNLIMVETLSFYENGSLYTSRSHNISTSDPPYWENHTVWSDYQIENSKICDIDRNSGYETCKNFIFKDNGNTLRLSSEGTAANYLKQ